jgi:hypothetical protein
MPTHKLTPEIVNAAIEGFEQQKLHIDAQIAELRAMLLGGRTEPATTPVVPKGKRRKMSAAARKRIGDAQRKRWAESKGQSVSRSKPKRKLSAAGKAAIVAALKKRWAAKRAAAVKTAPVMARKGVKTDTVKRAVAKKVAKKTGGKRAQKKAAKAPEAAATAQ